MPTLIEDVSILHNIAKPEASSLAGYSPGYKSFHPTLKLGEIPDVYHDRFKNYCSKQTFERCRHHKLSEYMIKTSNFKLNALCR